MNKWLWKSNEPKCLFVKNEPIKINLIEKVSTPLPCYNVRLISKCFSRQLHSETSRYISSKVPLVQLNRGNYYKRFLIPNNPKFILIKKSKLVSDVFSILCRASLQSGKMTSIFSADSHHKTSELLEIVASFYLQI